MNLAEDLVCDLEIEDSCVLAGSRSFIKISKTNDEVSTLRRLLKMLADQEITCVASLSNRNSLTQITSHSADNSSVKPRSNTPQIVDSNRIRNLISILSLPDSTKE